MNKMFLFIVLLMQVACSSGYVPENGDLLFRVDNGAAAAAIKESTHRGKHLPFTHVGVVMNRGGADIAVVEAVGNSVQITPYAKWLACAMTASDGSPLVEACRVDVGKTERDKAVERAVKCVGMPYDDDFMPDNGKMYCSELVWHSYRDVYSKPVLGSVAMTFKDTSGNFPDFWLKHFAKKGMAVPEGVQGTNPADMRGDSLVTLIYKYYR